jgi:hypothetical protein
MVPEERARAARPPQWADHAHAQPQHHTTQHFPTDTTDLEHGAPPEIVDIPDGGSFDLSIAPVAKRLGDATVRMLADNGSVPGPTPHERPAGRGRCLVLADGEEP